MLNGYRDFTGQDVRFTRELRSLRGLGITAQRTRPFEAAGTRPYRRAALVVRNAVVEHVFHPIPAPERHAEQVIAWLRNQ